MDLAILFPLESTTYETIKQENEEVMASCLPCDGSRCPGKSRWPELVGMKASKAKKIIEMENPRVKVVYLGCHGQRQMDCCCNRVILYLNYKDRAHLDDGTVCHVPLIG